MNIKKFLEDYAKDYVKNRQLSGTIMVSRNEDIVVNQSLGFADGSANIKCCTNTQYLIGSVTKQFTAVALLKALYDNVITSDILKDDVTDIKKRVNENLNEPIASYLPAAHEIWAADMPKWAHIITLHQLLTHSSGLVNYSSLPEFKDDYINPPEVPELVKFFKHRELEFPIGSKHSYSNSGYLLLGEIIRELTGQALNAYFETIFFKPLNMLKTFLATKGTVHDLKKMKQFKELARGYEIDITSEKPEVKEVEKYCPMQIAYAAGGMVSTAPDLLLWNSALYTEKVLPNFLLDLVLSPHLKVNDATGEFYGYGTEIIVNPALGIIYGHGGSINGFSSQLMYIPSLKLSIICLSNIAGSWEKLEPEVTKLRAQLPVTLSLSEEFKIVDAELRKKFPAMNSNEDHHFTAGFVANLIKVLSGVVTSK